MRKFLLSTLAVLSLSGAFAAERGVRVGDRLPALQVEFAKNAAPELNGKAVLVEFWATWCPLCIASIPHLNELYNKYAEKGLAIVAVTVETEKEIRRFRKKVPIDYPVGYAQGPAIFLQFKIGPIPEAFLANKAGKIIWQGSPSDLTDKIIQKALK